MKITHLNHAAFLIEVNDKRIVIDPYNPEFTGMKWKELDADIVCITHDHEDHNYVEGVKGDPFIISAPGEYEVGNISIQGIQAFHDEKQGAERGAMTLYLIRSDEAVVGHFGNLGHDLEEEQQKELEAVNVLLVPVDGVSSIKASVAAEVVAEIEPNIVIPMHYNVKGTKTEGWKFAELEDFLKEMGVEEPEQNKVFEIKSKSSLPEETEVVVLEPTY